MAVGYAVAGTAQFTPRQVLEAGRRAEADGKRDYAIQFYQHVLAHHGATSEAIEADDALRRMTVAEPDAGYGANGYPLIAQASNSAHMNSARSNGAHLGHVNGHGHAPATVGPPVDAGTGRPGHAPSQGPGPQGHSIRAAPAVEPRSANGTAKTNRRHKPVEARDDALHEGQRRKIRHYRLGRFMAALIGLGGGLAALAGLIALGANLALLLTKTNGLLSMAAISPLFASGLLAGACVMILLSQIGKATFDAARDRWHD